MSAEWKQFVLLGSGGMLGRAFTSRMPDAVTPSRDQVDMNDPKTIDSLSLDSSSMLINCTGYTDVDGAENDREQADRVNGESVGVLAQKCAQANALFVHFSTDYVFNGKTSHPYPVDAPLDPINAYGASKTQGEQLIRASGCRHLIVRSSWLYAPWGTNFVLSMLRLMKERDSIQVVNDQFGRPTSAEHLATTTMQLIEAGCTGIYHVTDLGQCSWFQFAEEIARLIEYRGRIEPCRTEEFPRPAKRPAYSVLDVSETMKVVGRMPEWRENLAQAIKACRT